MTQSPLDFTATHARSSDPDTSFAAADAVARCVALSCGWALEWIKSQGDRGSTYKELVAALGRRSYQQRLSDLKEAGLVVPNGERRDRCAVYVARETS